MKDNMELTARTEVNGQIRGPNDAEDELNGEKVFDASGICLRMNAFREKIGMSMTELADTSEVPFSTVRRYLRGQVPNPHMNTILAMAQVMEMPLDLLFYEMTQKETHPALETLADLYKTALERMERQDEIHEQERALDRKTIRRLASVLLVLAVACLVFMVAWAYLDATNGDIGIIRYHESFQRLFDISGQI